MDTCRIVNSYKFPTLVTIEVDGIPKSPMSPVAGRDPEEWRLASADPRDANKSKYKLHTLDIYFWMQEDARLVTECFKKLLQRQQLDVVELEQDSYHDEAVSPEKHANAMSPLVQNLENMAVSDPAYNGRDQNRDRSRQTSAVSPSSSFASHKIPPPPPGGLPGGQQVHSPSPAISDMSSQPGRQSSVRSSDRPQSQNFAPMAYNPAAPAAPEPIAHREKTPPPEDGMGGTGLNVAARNEQGYTPGMQQQQQRQQQQGGYQIGQGQPIQYSFGPPPPPGPPSQAFSSPPTQQQVGTYSAPPPPPPSTAGYSSPPPQSSYSYAQSDPRSSMTSAAAGPSFGPGAPSTIVQQQKPPLGQIQGAEPDNRHSLAAEQYTPHNPSSGAPALTPGSQFYSTIPQPAKPLAHVQPQYADYLSSGSTPVQPSFSPAQNTSSPQPPVGGYSNYDYRTGSGQGQHGGNPYDVHQQVYRPTEAEAGAHGHKKPSRTNTNDGRKPSTAERAEKKVGRFFKKIEKTIG